MKAFLVSAACWLLGLMAAIASPFRAVPLGKQTGYIIPVAAVEAQHMTMPSEDRNVQVRYWTPSETEVRQAAGAVKKWMREVAEHPESAFSKGRIVDLPYEQERIKTINRSYEEYGIQFVGMTVKGRKMIYCNYFAVACVEKGEASRSFIEVCDGGTGFWQVRYDCDSGMPVDLRINGVG